MGRDPICPICNSDLPMGGDERQGEEIFCSQKKDKRNLKIIKDEQDSEEYFISRVLAKEKPWQFNIKMVKNGKRKDCKEMGIYVVSNEI